MRRRGRRPIDLICLSIAAALAGCAGEKSGKDSAEDTRSVDLLVSADGIEIRNVEPLPTHRLTHHVDALTTLEYRLIDRDGNEVIRARMPDFRWAHSEAMDPDTGTLSRADFRLPSATGTIRLPAIAGELVVLEPQAGGAVELGRAAYDPDALTTALLSSDDILGEPVLIAGGGSKEGAIDVLLLPEAFKEDQLTSFHETAVRIADEFLAQPDWGSYADRINVWYLDVRSDEDKLDSGGLFGDHYDTAFDARWGGGGLFGIIGNVPDNCTTYGDGWVARAIGDALEADMVVMIANVDGVRGLFADDMVNMGRDNSGVTMAHELGHAILDLGDEYAEESGGFEGFRCGTRSFLGIGDSVNVQPDVDDLPWWDLLTPGVQLPTAEDGAGDDVIGAFEGANLCESDWYRPQMHCLMRDHAEMCAVCRRELDTLMGGLSTEPPSCPEAWRGDGICDLCLHDDPDCEVQRVCDTDGVCDENEHCSACPEDCGSCPVGGGCGDGACANNETDSSCPVDCGCSAGAECTNGPAPYGCYCDSACEGNGDCCADHSADCQ